MRTLIIAALLVSMLGLSGCALMRHCPVCSRVFNLREEPADSPEAKDKPTAHLRHKAHGYPSCMFVAPGVL